MLRDFWRSLGLNLSEVFVFQKSENSTSDSKTIFGFKNHFWYGPYVRPSHACWDSLDSWQTERTHLSKLMHLKLTWWVCDVAFNWYPRRAYRGVVRPFSGCDQLSLLRWLWNRLIDASALGPLGSRRQNYFRFVWPENLVREWLCRGYGEWRAAFTFLLPNFNECLLHSSWAAYIKTALLQISTD